jgi:hypothetical protein
MNSQESSESNASVSIFFFTAISFQGNFSPLVLALLALVQLLVLVLLFLLLLILVFLILLVLILLLLPSPNPFTSPHLTSFRPSSIPSPSPN